MDYADYNDRNLLIVTDAHSKWVEIYLTGAINSTTTIEKSRCCFATHGLPNLFVSDTGSCFTSLEFAEFTRKNGIKHKLVCSYHQASNGEDESSVKIVKSELRMMSGRTLETNLSRVLQDNTPYYRSSGWLAGHVLEGIDVLFFLDKITRWTSYLTSSGPHEVSPLF